MDPTPSHAEREERFRAVDDATYLELPRFRRRRVDAADADDLVADVMLVAWRRPDDVPVDISGARAWLFGVARHTLLNSRRRADRRDAVDVRLAEVERSAPDGSDAHDPAAHRGDGFFGSYTTDPAPRSDGPPAGGIEKDTSMTGSIPSGSPWPFSRDDWFSWVEGFVGRDVVAVTVHPPVGPDVEASVVDGRYAAWWPAGKASGDNPGLGGAFCYTLTLADGTTRDVAG